jgi:antagonist of KipI
MIFISVGLQPTFQDSGRFGFQSSGVNPDGVMDSYTFRVLNILLQNNENEGVLEMNFPAPKLLFEENTTICIGGADFAAMLNDQLIPLFKTVNVSIGDVLAFTKKISGERAYLAVKGGFDLKKWLGSVSYNQAVKLPDPKIEKGLSVGLKTCEQVEQVVWLGNALKPHLTQAAPTCPHREGSVSLPSYLRGGGSSLRFLPAPEYDLLTEESKQNLQNSPFQITKDANRMGYRLRGEVLETIQKVSLLSSAVTFGTMQLLPDGQIIILMASHQTTGGYPRIGTIIAVDLLLLTQCGANQFMQFEYVSVGEGERLYLEREQQLQRLKTSILLTLAN